MSAAPEDDEIEASRAPLLDHLVELRSRLIVCVVALFVGFLICFVFSTQIFTLLLHPFNVASGLLAVRAQEAKSGGSFDILGALNGAKNMFLVLTGLRDAPPVPGKVTQLVFTAPLEFFFTKVKLSALGAVALTFPVLAQQVYAFVAPGLYKRERRAFLPFLVASPVLFALGAAMVYFMILPFVLWFAASQQIVGVSGISVNLLPKVSEYFDLVTTLLLAFGLCFQLPVVLTLLGMAGLVNSKMLMSGWRYAVVAVVVVAAIITPPDPISQTLLSVPIIGLYFISVGCVWLIELRRKKEDDARDVTVT
ncbi:MAG: sec-independent protein secretion pathway component TatC [Phenylobacterium sp.]|uniref:twin-arginine translocase subunit TatC n=1 Tax=Phenylobacterium sp. TaxID=1871053 RepID=UPI00260791F8|nr:twin-arginine translocase subunit TatC [Phenylobacterium sp.]MDB5499259.1 sec-independent protein secretion pathway component TatC [Phenylobacterium sp.]